MLARTAANIFWMGRSLERITNAARMIQAAMQMNLIQVDTRQSHWQSLLSTNGQLDSFAAEYPELTPQNVLDYLVRHKNNPSSILNLIEQARHNARIERSRLSRETFEAINSAWRNMTTALKRPVSDSTALDTLINIRNDMAFIRGTIDSTMLRTEFFNFFMLGTYIERADNTARIVDVKYYLLLPSASLIGSGLDNTQWEAILRIFSALHAYNWVYKGKFSAANIADFLLLDKRLPRSLYYCYSQLLPMLQDLDQAYEKQNAATASCVEHCQQMSEATIDEIFHYGLHEYITEFIAKNNRLGQEIAQNYHLS